MAARSEWGKCFFSLCAQARDCCLPRRFHASFSEDPPCCCFLVDEPMDLFSNPIKINFLMGVSIPQFFPFLFLFLIISCVCSHPSTLSFSFERQYSICFGLQKSDSVFSWNIYHLRYCKIMSLFLSTAYNILLFSLNYT